MDSFTAEKDATKIFWFVLVTILLVALLAIYYIRQVSKEVMTNITVPTNQLVEAAAGLRRGDLKASAVLT